MSGAVPRFPRTYLLFALSEEAAPFLRRMAVVPALRRECEVRISGVGIDNAGRATAQLLAEGPVKCLIVCGFGGGLTTQMTPGSLIVANRVLDATGGGSAVPTIYRPDSRMRESADGEGGDLVTVGNVLTTPDEKHALHARTQAHMVDMETAGAVRAAEQAGVPWLAVRAATDSVDAALPFDFNAFTDSEGNIDRRRVVAATLKQPWKIPALIRLGGHSTLAAKNLGRFLETYLQQRSD